MFRLYEPAFEDAIEEWGKLSSQLQLEKENIQAIMNTMSQAWTGETQRDFDKIYRDMLTTGLYEQTAEIVERIYRLQYNILPNIIAQMARCHKMGEQLLNDDYIPPYLSGQGYYNNGLLALDEDYVEGFNYAVEEVVEQASEARRILAEVINDCGGLIDLAQEREELEAGYRKVMRIRNFQKEFNLYVREVKEIEEELTSGLRAIMASDTDPYNQKWTAILQNLNTNQKHKYALELLSTVKVSAEVEAHIRNEAALQELLEELEEKGLTLEQYRAAVLDSFMYLDIFNDDPENGYYFGRIEKQLNDGMTVNEILELLSAFDIYTDGSKVDGSTRHVYYTILTDAVKRDPALGNFEVSHMSRMKKKLDTGLVLNEGTNGMVFTDPVQDTIYVAYRGTSMGEWGDDGERFNCKSMDDLTPQMEQTLGYFNYVAQDMGWRDDMKIYVTGHSQGGNDAQISILLSPYGKYVDACYSFDGEGHSPELLADIKNKYGEEEYESRVSRMYSICGEYDFVNHLGEKVIREENTLYIKCNFEKVDIARAHDIVSMFCDENMNYNGMINTSKGTAPSWVIKYTAKAWEELYEMPDSMRASCQAALMNAAEAGLSGFKCTEGLNGEKASLKDYATFLSYGIPVLTDSAGKVVRELLREQIVDDYANQLLDKAMDSGWMPEIIATEVKEEINDLAELYLETYELKTDLEELPEYMEYTVKNLPNILLNGEDISWENHFISVAGEKCVDYVMNRYEDVKEDVQEVIEVGKAGWNMIQDVAVTTGKKILENSADIIDFMTKIPVTGPIVGPVMPLKIGN